MAEPLANSPEAARLSGQVAVLRSSVETAYRKLKWSKAVEAMFQLGPWLLGGLCLVAGLVRFELVSGVAFSLAVFVAMLALLLGALRATRGTNRMQAALAVDHKFALQGNFAAAYEFSGAARPDGFAQLVIHEAGRRLPPAPAQAIAISIPSNATSLAVLVLGLCALLFVPAPERVQPPAPIEAPKRALMSTLSHDDAELLKQRAQQLLSSLESEEARRFASDFNELVLKLSDGSLSQSDGFKEVAALVAELEQRAKDGEALTQGLIERGEVLKRKNVTQAVGRALSERRFADAQEALKKLAERLKSGDQGLNKQELEELRASLEQLRKEQEAEHQRSQKSDPTQAERTQLEKKRDELQKKAAQGTASNDEMKQLAETERELKRLSRQRKQQQEQAQKQLSELDQKLLEAAQALAQERKKSGEFLQEAAQQVKQATARTLSDEEKKELIKQLEALKERLREQNQQGDQAQRMRDFQRRARGQSQQPAEGEGENGAGQASGQPQINLVPGGPQAGAGKEGQGKPGDVQGEAEDASAAGKEAGHGHDEQIKGEVSRLHNTAVDDKAAAGQDTGQGQSASETIASAAERGFVSGHYQKLYHEYETVAEEVMDKEQIPPGRRSHVRRYFELIRPREGQ